MQILLTLAFLFVSTSTHAQFSQQERDRAALQKLFKALHDVSKMELKCEKDDDCLVYSAGSKACGGPTDYVVTSTFNQYLPYVEYLSKQTKEKEHEFNVKYQIMSDCSLRMAPVPVCEAKVCNAQ